MDTSQMRRLRELEGENALYMRRNTLVMSNKPDKIDHKKPKEILKSNPKVSHSVVAQYRELERKLKKLGVDTKPRYTLSHPFDGYISDLLKK